VATDAQTSDSIERVTDETLDQLIRNLQKAKETPIATVIGAFDEVHDKTSWKEALQTTVAKAREMSIWPPGQDYQKIRDAIDAVTTDQSTSVVEAAKTFKPPESTESVQNRLAAWSKLPLPSLLTLSLNVQILNAFLTALEKTCQTQVSAMGDVEALDQRNALVASLVWEFP
jgi:hypothetical protein